MSPDASWVPNSVLAQHGKAALSKVTGAVVTPVFVAEIRSPSDRLKEQLEKCERWIKAGVKEAWMVDPCSGLYTFFVRERTCRCSLIRRK